MLFRRSLVQTEPAGITRYLQALGGMPAYGLCSTLMKPWRQFEKEDPAVKYGGQAVVGWLNLKVERCWGSQWAFNFIPAGAPRSTSHLRFSPPQHDDRPTDRHVGQPTAERRSLLPGRFEGRIERALRGAPVLLQKVEAGSVVVVVVFVAPETRCGGCATTSIAAAAARCGAVPECPLSEAAASSDGIKS
jgi:hypothetical protein